MRLLITVLLSGLFLFQSFSQDHNDKSVLLISTKYYSENCEHVAFQITNNKIKIDNCYNLDDNKFNTNNTIDLKEEPTIKAFFEKSVEDLWSYEMEINAIRNCDFLSPIIIIISIGEKETRIEWKGIQNCYPETLRYIVEGIEEVFIKYK